MLFRSQYLDPVFAPSIVDNKSSGIFKLTSNDDDASNNEDKAAGGAVCFKAGMIEK